MKQLHKQSSANPKRDEEIPSTQLSPYSPKTLKHPRSLPRSINYLFREQRLLFILVGILIGSTFFILQPSLSRLGPAQPHSSIPRSFSVTDREELSRPYGGSENYGVGKVTGRVPVGIGRRRLRIVVTGGAGFVENVMHHFGNPRFELIRHDVVEPILLEVDQIYHLACPASPVHYKYNPVKTIKTNVMGTLNMLGLAKRIGARFLLTSTSEVYGDPLEHPQKETYWGNVNPIGVRSCYDEGKRTAETLTMDYHRGAGVEVRIARIFNTYGPRMCLDDGRVVSNFVAQAIRKQPLTVYGDGKQTRSFQYVSDLVLSNKLS
ncbi:hypothetical protein F0562_017015 [Nyssa sinensis]|uniref:UDP-glucuronic acid decarboxylase 1 n=1 Tax=Nyssa sinensis TaxID=561372 RepID=A0A5J4ZEP8_9ASTE|nr:hypothetical protein F0562_017015 [Nyssa sinensis]